MASKVGGAAHLPHRPSAQDAPGQRAPGGRRWQRPQEPGHAGHLRGRAARRLRQGLKPLRYDHFSIEITKNYKEEDWYEDVDASVLGFFFSQEPTVRHRLASKIAERAKKCSLLLSFLSRSHRTLACFEQLKALTEIKRLLMTVGGGSQEAPVQTTFLLADTQIPKESFLEDTSSLLNNGEVWPSGHGIALGEPLFPMSSKDF